MAKVENAMPKTETIRARVEPALKRDAEAILRELGMTPTEAITLFYRQVSFHNGLPFSVRIPNAATRRALSDARAGRGMETFKSVADWAKAMRQA